MTWKQLPRTLKPFRLIYFLNHPFPRPKRVGAFQYVPLFRLGQSHLTPDVFHRGPPGVQVHSPGRGQSTCPSDSDLVGWRCLDSQMRMPSKGAVSTHVSTPHVERSLLGRWICPPHQQIFRAGTDSRAGTRVFSLSVPSGGMHK